MEKVKDVLNPGHSKDDEILYGAEQSTVGHADGPATTSGPTSATAPMHATTNPTASTSTTTTPHEKHEDTKESKESKPKTIDRIKSVFSRKKHDEPEESSSATASPLTQSTAPHSATATEHQTVPQQSSSTTHGQTSPSGGVPPFVPAAALHNAPAHTENTSAGASVASIKSGIQGTPTETTGVTSQPSTTSGYVPEFKKPAGGLASSYSPLARNTQTSPTTGGGLASSGTQSAGLPEYKQPAGGLASSYTPVARSPSTATTQPAASSSAAPISDTTSSTAPVSSSTGLLDYKQPAGGLTSSYTPVARSPSTATTQPAASSSTAPTSNAASSTAPVSSFTGLLDYKQPAGGLTSSYTPVARSPSTTTQPATHTTTTTTHAPTVTTTTSSSLPSSTTAQQHNSGVPSSTTDSSDHTGRNAALAGAGIAGGALAGGAAYDAHQEREADAPLSQSTATSTGAPSSTLGSSTLGESSESAGGLSQSSAPVSGAGQSTLPVRGLGQSTLSSDGTSHSAAPTSGQNSSPFVQSILPESQSATANTTDRTDDHTARNAGLVGAGAGLAGGALAAGAGSHHGQDRELTSSEPGSTATNFSRPTPTTTTLPASTDAPLSDEGVVNHGSSTYTARSYPLPTSTHDPNATSYPTPGNNLAGNFGTTPIEHPLPTGAGSADTSSASDPNPRAGIQRMDTAQLIVPGSFPPETPLSEQAPAVAAATAAMYGTDAGAGTAQRSTPTATTGNTTSAPTTTGTASQQVPGDEAHHHGRDAALAGGAGAAAIGAATAWKRHEGEPGTQGNEYSDNLAGGGQPYTSHAVDPRVDTSARSGPLSTDTTHLASGSHGSAPNTTATPGTSTLGGSQSATSEPHHGRDAAVAGGLGAPGTAAGIGAYEHSKPKDSLPVEQPTSSTTSAIPQGSSTTTGPSSTSQSTALPASSSTANAPGSHSFLSNASDIPATGSASTAREPTASGIPPPQTSPEDVKNESNFGRNLVAALGAGGLGSAAGYHAYDQKDSSKITTPETTVPGTQRPEDVKNESNTGRNIIAALGAGGLGSAGAHHAYDTKDSARDTAPTSTLGAPSTTGMSQTPSALNTSDANTHGSTHPAITASPTYDPSKPISATNNPHSTASEAFPEDSARSHDKGESHLGRNVAAGAGAAGLGAAGAHAYDKHHNEPTTSTAGAPHATSAPLAGLDGTTGTAGTSAHPSTVAGTSTHPTTQHATSRFSEDQDDSHRGRNAAIGAATGAGAGAAGAYALDQHSKEADAERLKELEKERKHAEKEAEKEHKHEAKEAEKEHKHEVKEAEKEHKKEVKEAEKEHKKEIKAIEKEHKKEEKEAEKEEKKREKEEEKRQKELAKEEEKRQKELAKEEERREKEAAKAEKEKKGGLLGFLHKKKDGERTAEEEAEDERHERERLAAGGLGAAGVAGAGGAAYAAHDHHAQDPTFANPGQQQQSALQQHAALAEPTPGHSTLQHATNQEPLVGSPSTATHPETTQHGLESSQTQHSVTSDTPSNDEKKKKGLRALFSRNKGDRASGEYERERHSEDLSGSPSTTASAYAHYEGRNRLHKDPPKDFYEKHGVLPPGSHAESTSAANVTSHDPAGYRGTSIGDEERTVIEPHTGLPMKIGGQYGTGAGGTDGNPNIAGYHQHDNV